MLNGYKRWIPNHNVEKFSLMISDDINMFLSTKILTWIDKNAVLQVNSMNSAKKIEEELS